MPELTFSAPSIEQSYNYRLNVSSTKSTNNSYLVKVSLSNYYSSIALNNEAYAESTALNSSTYITEGDYYDEEIALIPSNDDLKVYVSCANPNFNIEYTPLPVEIVSDVFTYTKPTVKSKAFDGEWSLLCTEATANYGHIYYGVTTVSGSTYNDKIDEDIIWSDEIPEEYEAGTYYIWMEVDLGDIQVLKPKYCGAAKITSLSRNIKVYNGDGTVNSSTNPAKIYWNDKDSEAKGAINYLTVTASDLDDEFMWCTDTVLSDATAEKIDAYLWYDDIDAQGIIKCDLDIYTYEGSGGNTYQFTLKSDKSSGYSAASKTVYVKIIKTNFNYTYSELPHAIYNGTKQIICDPKNYFKVNNFLGDEYSVAYSWGSKTSPSKVDTDGDGVGDTVNWNTDYTKFGKTNANTYYLWVRLKATDYNTATFCIPWVIEKAEPTFTPPTPKIGLKYNSSSTQKLATAGTVTGGTMKYAVTNENEAMPLLSKFSTTIPSKKDAGTYWVWYYVVGDSNHTDTTPQYIVCSIGKSTSELKQTIKSDKTSGYHNQQYTAKITFSDLTGLSLSNISISSSNSAVSSFEKVSISGNVLTIKVTNKKAGTANCTFTIPSVNGKNGTYKAYSGKITFSSTHKLTTVTEGSTIHKSGCGGSCSISNAFHQLGPDKSCTISGCKAQHVTVGTSGADILVFTCSNCGHRWSMSTSCYAESQSCGCSECTHEEGSTTTYKKCTIPGCTYRE